MRMKKLVEDVYDVWVFFLDANAGVEVLFPRGGASSRLAAGANLEVSLTGSGWVDIVDDALGVENIVVLAFPAGRLPCRRRPITRPGTRRDIALDSSSSACRSPNSAWTPEVSRS